MRRRAHRHAARVQRGCEVSCGARPARRRRGLAGQREWRELEREVRISAVSYMRWGRRYGMTVRLARFQNCYGPEGTWRGGREKAPAALSRKIAEAADGGTIEIWGDGTAMRAYTYIDDMVDGIRQLMDSGLEDGVNIGRQEYVSVDELASTIASVAGKTIHLRHIEGPVGVKARNFRIDRISGIGWRSRFSLREGIARTYPWVKARVEAERRK